MKAILPEWYDPDEDEIRDFVVNATIALDANVLLAMYRVSDSQRKQILHVLDQVSNRLWIPFQVALEYQRNRLGVAATQHNAYDALRSIGTEKYKETIQAAVDSLRDLRNQAMNGLRDKQLRRTIENGFDKTILEIETVAERRREEMTEEFENLRKAHSIDFSTARTNDPIRAALDRILTKDRVGVRPDPSIEEQRRIDACARIEAKLPPGYKDSGKDDPVGDCMIWFELLEHAESSQRKILFITNDVKEDYYRRINGQTVGPRVEMRAEMLERSGQSFHQTTLDQFLRYANNFLKAQISEETINTLESNRKTAQTRRVYGVEKAIVDDLLSIRSRLESIDIEQDSIASRRSVAAQDLSDAESAIHRLTLDILDQGRILSTTKREQLRSELHRLECRGLELRSLLADIEHQNSELLRSRKFAVAALRFLEGLHADTPVDMSDLLDIKLLSAAEHKMQQRIINHYRARGRPFDYVSLRPPTDERDRDES
ncbi:PIN domain-containing protein [Nocardia sp. XZ_19_385]|uniref:PIN domain-containing protein n=1 Tax=Nocardia sp. XZ_19_385 TaxID=2769488 RepID=UPI00188F819A|nr:PIN-like domain-containing protein [Nocardia sp. XZ_19_385]